LRLHSRSASHQKNGAPDQEGPHHGYEVSSANHSAPLLLACVPCY
jgi:hypothetical protein